MVVGYAPAVVTGAVAVVVAGKACGSAIATHGTNLWWAADANASKVMLWLGGGGAAAAGITRAKIGIRSPLSGRMRFPDEVTPTVLREVKNVRRLGWTAQLRDYNAIAQSRGLRFELWVRETTQMTRPLLEAIEKFRIVVRYIPS